MTGLFWTIMTASSPIEPDQQQDSLQAHFHPQVPFDEIEQVFHLKRAQPLLQAFTALFHGGFDGVLVRLLVLRELAADTDGTAYTRGDINVKLAYLVPDSLETVLGRLRAHNLLAWDAQQGVYRVTPMARNVLAALEGLMKMGQPDDEAEVGFLMSQVAGSQAMGQITAEQLQHLLGRLVDLTEEFRDAIASGSEFRCARRKPNGTPPATGSKRARRSSRRSPPIPKPIAPRTAPRRPSAARRARC
jgi:hypothetical protein